MLIRGEISRECRKEALSASSDRVPLLSPTSCVPGRGKPGGNQGFFVLRSSFFVRRSAFGVRRGAYSLCSWFQVSVGLAPTGPATCSDPQCNSGSHRSSLRLVRAETTTDRRRTMRRQCGPVETIPKECHARNSSVGIRVSQKQSISMSSIVRTIRTRQNPTRTAEVDLHRSRWRFKVLACWLEACDPSWARQLDRSPDW